MFVRIANESDAVNRLFLEKLGISTKRDNDATIGQFGSGSKFAPIAALRRGMRWVNVGTDDRGDYIMEYGVRDVSGFETIVFDYGDEVKESSYTLDAGLLSWDSSFQIFREAFSNALDANTEFGAEYSIEIVDEIEHIPGMFCVYLTADDEILDIVKNLKKYFLLDREPVAVAGDIRAFPCIDGVPKVYYKGVLVAEYDPDDLGYALYDYELNSITLNEERRVRYDYEVLSQVATFLRCTTNHDVIRKFIKADGENHWEFGIPSHRYEGLGFSALWADVWREIHGDLAIPLPAHLGKFRALVRLQNRQPIVVQEDLIVHAVTSSGAVESVENIVGDDGEYEWTDLDDEGLTIFESCLKLVRKVVPDVDSIVDEFKWFIPTDLQRSILGVASHKNMSVYLNRDILFDQTKLIGTIVHEYHHLATGFDDGTAEFRSIADDMIANLIVRMNVVGEA